MVGQAVVRAKAAQHCGRMTALGGLRASAARRRSARRPLFNPANVRAGQSTARNVCVDPQIVTGVPDDAARSPPAGGFDEELGVSSREGTYGAYWAFGFATATADAAARPSALEPAGVPDPLEAASLDGAALTACEGSCVDTWGACFASTIPRPRPCCSATDMCVALGNTFGQCHPHSHVVRAGLSARVLCQAPTAAIADCTAGDVA